MVQQVINEIYLNNLNWYRKYPPLRKNDLVLLNKIPYNLPLRFIDLLKISDGGALENTDFEYHDVYFQELMAGSIGMIYSVCHNDTENLILYYLDPPEMFPENLVIFGVNGGGDSICFDYRNNQDTDNPPIVYYHHGLPTENCVSFIANNFEEFLTMLKKPDDE